MVTQISPSVVNRVLLHFATYGEIHQWVSLEKSFARIMIVYKREEDAELAKSRCGDRLVLEATHDTPRTILGVYRSVKINLSNDSSDDHYLRPPAIEKNFLISPPGSPPVGWEPVKEDPPNPTPLADDLIAALRKLQVHNRRSSRELLLEPEDGVGVTVYVEECGMDEADDAAEEDWVYGQPSPARQKWTPLPTSLPPMCMAV
jgi:hypothetical protein